MIQHSLRCELLSGFKASYTFINKTKWSQQCSVCFGMTGRIGLSPRFPFTMEIPDSPIVTRVVVNKPLVSHFWALTCVFSCVFPWTASICCVSCAGNIAAEGLRCSLTHTHDHLPGARGCHVRPGSTAAHSQVERQSAQA